MEQEKLQEKITKLQVFLEENKLGITAVQQISKDNRIECVPLFHDLEKYEATSPVTSSNDDPEDK